MVVGDYTPQAVALVPVRDAIEQSHRKINRAMHNFTGQRGFGSIRHGLINTGTPGYFCKGGVHLSQVGMDLFPWTCTGSLGNRLM